jgi:hypothetical protein
MNNQTIIELREQDPTASNIEVANWSNTLEEVITVYENDSISLKGAFVDSVAQNSGRIVVQPDDESAPAGSDLKEKATISIRFAYYFYDWGTSKGNLDDRSYIPTNHKYTSGRNFVLCDKMSLGGAEIIEIFSLTFAQNADPAIMPDPKNQIDPVQFYFYYLGVNGQTVHLNFSIYQKVLATRGFTGAGTGNNFVIDQALIDANPNCIISGSISFPFVAVKDGILGSDILPDTTVNPSTPKGVPFKISKPTGADVMRACFMDFVYSSSNPVGNADGDMYQPRLIDYSFKIDARDYAPDELARTISKGFTQSEQIQYIEDEFAVVDNPLLTTTRSLQVIGDAVVDNTNLPAGFAPLPEGTPNVVPYWVSDDGSTISNYNTNCDNYIVGTPQFDLQFNENIGAEGIFQIAQIHAPLIDSDGNTICKCIDVGVQAGANNQRVKYIANKNGGILINNLSPKYLWEDQMKFNTSKLYTTFTMVSGQTIGGIPKIRIPVFKVVDGVNATGHLKSIDIPYDKDTTFDLVKAFPYNVKSPLLTVINAEDNLDGDSALDSGYYLVEITSNFFTDKRNGKETKKNIMGIVSRFYQQDSFTSAIDGEGSFTYIHKGEPIQISNFGCRILNPDHTLATGLKDNNTVFIQVNRAGT